MSRIFVVEDSPIVLEGLKYIVDPEMKIIPYLRGNDFLEGIKNNEDIDLALIDLNLPDISGEEVFDKLSIIKPNLKIAAISATENIKRISDILSGGWDGFISKRLGLKEIRYAIKKIITVGGKTYIDSETLKEVVKYTNCFGRKNTETLLDILNKRLPIPEWLKIELFRSEDILSNVIFSNLFF